MILFFVSAHDGPTKSNLVVANKIASAEDVKLFAQNATRANLHASLVGPTQHQAVFAMAHGSKPAVYDNQGEAAIHSGDASSFLGSTVFAWACYTGVQLGNSMAQGGVTWWGYDSAITAPDDRPEYLEIYCALFRQVKDTFATGTDKASVDAVLEGIRIACIRAVKELDALGAPDDPDAMSLYSCCNQTWERLSVWLGTNSNAPLRHSLAPSPYFEI